MRLKQQKDLALRRLKSVAAHKSFSEMQANFFDDGLRD
jgi:hypothetical protein